MLGLMEKDLRLTLGRKQTLLIFFAMALIMGLSMDGAFLIGYLTMLATIVAIGTISYDEFNNGLTFLMTLPFERKTYVREKYLFSLLMAATAWVIGFVLYVVGTIIRSGGRSVIDELPMLLSVFPVIFLSAAFMIPLQLKYGSEKSRFVLFIVFGFIAILLFGTKYIFNGNRNPFIGLAEAMDSLPPVAVLLTLSAVCALAVYACYLWGIRVIEKKEF